MRYEINVARYKRHFFATHERSITDIDELKNVLQVFKEKFPESEGYEISVTKETRLSTTLDVEKVLKEED